MTKFKALLNPVIASVLRVPLSNFSTKSSSNLAKLRKATGHPFGLCREALAACDGDYSRALTWIEEEATKRGLAKAEKLKNRPMSHGLLGLMSSSKCVAIVEVNCETDFVSRNRVFQSLVASSTKSLFHNLSLGSRASGTYRFDEATLKTVPYTGSSSKTLADALAAAVASIGENMAISRGVGMVLSGDAPFGTSHLMAYCHMSNVGVKNNSADVHFGKYAAVLRYRRISDRKLTSGWQDRASRISHQLCQHIVGMNPRPSLTLDDIPPAANPDDEKCLLRQPFLFDESITVGTLLEQNEILLEDFVRVECGIEEG